MKRTTKLALWATLLWCCLGFRVFPGTWSISKEDPTVWIKFCGEDFAIEENDIEGDDPLVGVSGLMFSQVLQSVIDDYNAVPTSFLRLAVYPADPANPGAPATGDSAFTEEAAKVRTIELCFKETNPAAGVSGGYAQPKYEGRKIVGCEIVARTEHTKKAAFLTHLLTHELGHCFGLMHPQEATNSVMSYFNAGNGPFLRLQNDDFAGITFRYPEEESYAREHYTLGLSGCAPR